VLIQMLLLINSAPSLKILSHVITLRAETLKNEFDTHYPNYCGLSVEDEHRFDTELVSKIIGKLEHGKARDIDGLCIENLYYFHHIISIILGNFFQLII